MCDVCNEHNAYGLEEEETENSICWSCEKELDLYERTHVWKLIEDDSQVLVCNDCHNKLLPLVT